MQKELNLNITIKAEQTVLDALSGLVDIFEKVFNNSFAEPIPKNDPAPNVDPATATEPQHSLEDVKKALIELKNVYGKDAAKAILVGFGVAKATELKPETYDAVMTAIKGRLS